MKFVNCIFRVESFDDWIFQMMQSKILGIGSLVVIAFGVYYQREAIMRTLGRSQKT